MLRRFLPLWLLVSLPGLCPAQGPERLLSERTQLYLRWDGIDAHRNAFDETTLGKMMKDDTGIFLRALVGHLQKQVDGLADQMSPDLIAILKELPRFLEAVAKNGLRLGVEFLHISPVEVEVTLVFPKSGNADGPVFSFLAKVLRLGGFKTEQFRGKWKLAKFDPVSVRWLSAGKDAVIRLRVESQRTDFHRAGRFADLDLYKQVKAFREFPTWADGFVDTESLAKLTGKTNPDIKRLIADTGLDALKGITFHSGPDGPGEHCVIQVDLPEPRRGLLRVLDRKPVRLTELPPLPVDINSFFACHLDLTALFDAALTGLENAVKIMNPAQEDAVKQGITLAESVLGLKLRDDVFGSLDKLVVRYNSPGDGPLGFGTVSMVKVKDPEKLQAALSKLGKGISRFPFLDIKVAKTTYHGVTINEIRLGDESYRQLPSFAIHNGWLVYSAYPQPIRGFILRANGELPAWKMNADLTRRLGESPKEYVGIAISDPRPALKMLFSLGPTAAGMINNLTARLGPQARFDLSLLPNAHETTRHLFPNITVITDDGRRVRIETRASLLLPF